MSDQVSEKCDKCESVGVRVGVSYLGPNLGPLGRVACRTCVTLPERKEKSAEIQDQIRVTNGTYVAENVPRNL